MASSRKWRVEGKHGCEHAKCQVPTPDLRQFGSNVMVICWANSAPLFSVAHFTNLAWAEVRAFLRPPRALNALDAHLRVRQLDERLRRTMAVGGGKGMWGKLEGRQGEKRSRGKRRRETAGQARLAYIVRRGGAGLQQAARVLYALTSRMRAFDSAG